MISGLQQAVIDYPAVQILLDSLFLLLPIGLVLCCIANYRLQYYLAAATAVFNLIYAVLLAAVSPLSIEGFTAWMVLPLVLAFKKDATFYYLIQTMRYFFLLIFFSAGCWKIRAGGIFNWEQMSGILLTQHAAVLVEIPGSLFSRFINYLVIHQKLSYLLYLFATLSELIFVIGFFTKKFDKLLMVLFLLFVLFDYFLMGINYFSWVTFLGTFWFAGNKLNTSKI